MKIDKNLNLVSTIIRDGGNPVYIHVTPFPYEVIEENCLLLGNMFSNFISQVGGLGSARIAAMMLRKKLKQEQELSGSSGPTIVDDIQRLTTVIYNDNGEWKSSPFDAAMKNNVITADEYRDTEGEIVFFMVSSAIQKKELIAPTVGAVISMYGGQLTSSNAMEFRASLLKSNQATDTQPQSAEQETSFIPS
ncbi:hypothetical protein PL78_00205 [Yersinia entomophaga]|uniref:Uncharacterized protein n=1 Tax=Yersinia entomophaga TaxID=935293 RepID=A0ABM6BFU2_YERET|nr:hypothetical protein [Yersinia entomophaga]ANI28262.1 hypothetical protein PL78_00205 [Yersinia entomophaga]OWF84920.1 hypothetical protein B4914_18340 [Yersinia entomophaga]